MKTEKELNTLSEKIIGCAIKVHRELGPGLLESTYEQCLAYELSQNNLKCEFQKPLPVVYQSVKLDCGYRVDAVVENSIILELKSVENLLPIHSAQLLSYLQLSKLRVGLLINFNVKMLKSGLKRIVNNL